MKFPFTCILLLASVGIAAAKLPQKMPLQTYSRLWNNSPFTSKPPPPPPGETVNPLEDYALIGVSPIGGDKYRVTLINKKQPDERIMVFSDDKNSDFKILGVTRKSGDPLGTVVSMQNGSVTGTVSYEEKLLTLTPPAAAPQPPQIPGQPPVPGQPPQPNAAQVRQPRPRVVPPPTPAVPQQAQPAQQQQRPERRRN